jgi:multidrug resistance efflux pump
MKLLNPFYLSVVIGAGLLFWLLRTPPGDELALYGFAESSETEINYNFPVAVQEILVRPGQPVDSGEVLLRLIRRTPETKLADEGYRIDELRAEETAWREERRQRLKVVDTEYSTRRQEIEQRIEALTEDQRFQETLPDLTTIEVPEGDYRPLETRLERLRSDLDRLEREYTAEREVLTTELAYGSTPYRERIRRLEAEADFDAARREQAVELTAPAAGLIGSINCREGEFKGAYANLITFYEPHSDLIKGYLHEGLEVSVDTGDRFEAVGLNDETVRYTGTVIGLGSRIVEIPERLRKFPSVKSYGREVTISIPPDNVFLQKEKVGLHYLGEGLDR